jgi:hypothetical protein
MPTSKSTDISESKLVDKSGFHNWADVTEEHVYRLPAQIILMGIIYNPLWKLIGLQVKCSPGHFSENACYKIKFTLFLDSSISLVMKEMIK